MPSGKELVANRPLLGSDLKTIIMADVEKILHGDSMLTPHCAYGRVAYEVTVTLHLDNPVMPTHRTFVTSKPRSDNDKERDPSLAAIEGPPPLANPSEKAFVSSLARNRPIYSPNIARIEHGLPVTIVRKTQDGGSVEEGVVYPKEVLEDIAPSVTDTDRTAAKKAEFAAAAAGVPSAG